MPTLGFTLVELLAVVVILGIILAIAVPRIMDVIENTRESAYQINEGMMVSAARNYLVMNESKNPSEPGIISIITLDDLQNSELITSINDARDSNIECAGYVVVKNVDATTFDYTPHLKCGTNYETEGYINETLQNVDVLVVAGGGAGGKHNNSTATGAGGGGGGGVVFENIELLKDNYTIIVGDGGKANIYQSGESSSFDNIIGQGGGNGGYRIGHAMNGASGGGAGYDHSSNPGAGIVGQGYAGGNASRSSTSYGGGGGGGAGGIGISATDTLAGNGGQGVYYGDKFSDNYGENGWFAGGGGGGHRYSTLSQAVHGGGVGGGSGIAAEPGILNTGGGGGGVTGTNGIAGDGGSGIVLVRYPGHQRANGGTITTFNGYTIHAFTKVGEAVFQVLEF